MRGFVFLSAFLVASPAVAGVTAIGDLQYGSTATIKGVVEQITDEDEFRIADGSGAITVYIGPGIVPFDQGETITVNGIVDRELGRLELYAREAVRADGTSVTFDHTDE